VESIKLFVQLDVQSEQYVNFKQAQRKIS